MWTSIWITKWNEACTSMCAVVWFDYLEININKIPMCIENWSLWVNDVFNFGQSSLTFTDGFKD